LRLHRVPSAVPCREVIFLVGRCRMDLTCSNNPCGSATRARGHMKSLLILFSFCLALLMLESGVALGYRDSMPREVYERLEGFGVTFIERDGPVLQKEGCANVQRTLLKKGPLGKTLGMGLFAISENGASERLIGVELKDDERNPVFVWRSSDFWQIAACHFPDKYGGKG